MKEWNLATMDTRDEILQNVALILATDKGSVPYLRGFGIDYSQIDSPQGVSRARINADIVRTVQKYEPRVRVERVIWDSIDPLTGSAKPRVQLKFIEEA